MYYWHLHTSHIRWSFILNTSTQDQNLPSNVMTLTIRKGNILLQADTLMRWHNIYSILFQSFHLVNLMALYVYHLDVICFNKHYFWAIPLIKTLPIWSIYICGKHAMDCRFRYWYIINYIPQPRWYSRVFAFPYVFVN